MGVFWVDLSSHTNSLRPLLPLSYVPPSGYPRGDRSLKFLTRSPETTRAPFHPRQPTGSSTNLPGLVVATSPKCDSLLGLSTSRCWRIIFPRENPVIINGGASEKNNDSCLLTDAPGIMIFGREGRNQSREKGIGGGWVYRPRLEGDEWKIFEMEKKLSDRLEGEEIERWSLIPPPPLPLSPGMNWRTRLIHLSRIHYSNADYFKLSTVPTYSYIFNDLFFAVLAHWLGGRAWSGLYHPSAAQLVCDCVWAQVGVQQTR